MGSSAGLPVLAPVVLHMIARHATQLRHIVRPILFPFFVLQIETLIWLGPHFVTPVRHHEEYK